MNRILIVLISLLTLAAIACGNSEVAEEPTQTPPSTAAAPATAEEKTEQPAAKAEPEGTPVNLEQQPSQFTEPLPTGTFRRLWSDPPTLDPHLTGDTTSAGIVAEVFSGLVSLDTDLKLVPDIAESWTIEDGTVYTFKLRANAKFHNGKPVTAQDFKWSMERAAAPETASPVADTYLNDILGAEKYFDGEADEIVGIKVIDDHTLEITTDAPKAYFLAKLTYPTAHVLDREVVEAGGRSWWIDNPVGTGPFKLSEYRIGERIVLERNEDYYRDLAGVETIVMNLAGGQAMAMYENDEIEITGVGLYDLERVLDPNEPLNKELVVAPPGFSVSYIGFNTSMAPFDDVKFRQALNHAVDKQLIATGVLSELVEPAYSILPPGFPGYTEDIVGLQFDPELARKLLSESKYADAESRPRIVVTVPGTGGTIGLDLEVVLEMWKQELGVQVEIQQVEWATYLEDLDDKKFQAYAGLGWEADYPDPQDFLDILFHSESSINHGNFKNAEIDAVLEEARVEADIQKRNRSLPPGGADDRRRRPLGAHVVHWRPLRPGQGLRRRLRDDADDRAEAEADQAHRRRVASGKDDGCGGSPEVVGLPPLIHARPVSGREHVQARQPRGCGLRTQRVSLRSSARAASGYVEVHSKASPLAPCAASGGLAHDLHARQVWAGRPRQGHPGQPLRRGHCRAHPGPARAGPPILRPVRRLYLELRPGRFSARATGTAASPFGTSSSARCGSRPSLRLQP